MTKTKAGPIVADRLKSFIERIERMEEEQAALASDKRDIYAEAKGVGYDIKTMRKVVALRKMDAADRAEQETLLDTYLHALGMVDRIEARAAAGESARQIAAAENVSKSTAHRVSQKTRNAENGTPTESCGGVESRHAREPDPERHAGEGDTVESVKQPQPEVAPGPQDSIDLTLPRFLDRRTQVPA